MATLEQIGKALKNAAAAGDTAAATKLARAYRQMQAVGGQAAPYEPNAMQQAGVQATADPRSTPQKGYDYALEQVRQTDYPQVPAQQFQQKIAPTGPMDPGVFQPLNPQEIAQNDQLFGFGDELSGLANASAEALQGKDFGKSYAAFQKLQEARRALGLEKNGALGEGASILGQLTSLGTAAPARVAAASVSAVPRTTLQRAAQIGKDMFSSGATGAAMGGVQGFGSTDGDVGQRLQGAKQGAIAGGLVGAAAPVAIRAIAAPFEKAAANRAVTSAIKTAPDASELRSMSSQMFKAVDNSGVTVDTPKFSQFVNDAAKLAKKDRINPTLDPKAHAAYEELIGALSDVQANGGALTVSDLHTLRQIAQRAATSTEGRDAMFAQRIVDGLDIFVTKPGNLKFPPNRLGSAPNASTGNQLLSAISTWGRASRVGLVEDAIKAAQNYPSGVESGLRAQFKSLLNNKGTRRLFSATEREAMQKVVNGGAVVSGLRVLGMFRGLSGATLGGMFGGPAGAVAGAAIGMGGRKVTELATEAAANRAAKIVATPNLPAGGVNTFRIPSTPLPLLVSRQGQ